jgi:hypothetical protein
MTFFISEQKNWTGQRIPEDRRRHWRLGNVQMERCRKWSTMLSNRSTIDYKYTDYLCNMESSWWTNLKRWIKVKNGWLKPRTCEQYYWVSTFDDVKSEWLLMWKQWKNNHLILKLWTRRTLLVQRKRETWLVWHRLAAIVAVHEIDDCKTWIGGQIRAC